ncbi:hypothetical protein [Kitasatospora sp. NPDC002040]|uniref:hypothetical protein n=1 Tax=Kitasatospora sp. NPDC002040 TaxID=3154661 RepID=UPI003332884D
MKRMITGAALALTALALTGTPADAASNNTIGDVVSAPAGWHLAPTALCTEELAPLPALPGSNCPAVPKG